MNSIYLLIILTLGVLTPIYAQKCGTEPNPDWLLEKEQMGGRTYLHAPIIKNRSNFVIPIRYYIVRKSDKSNGFPIYNLLEMHCKLNQNYLPVGIQFALDSVIYIDNDGYYNLDNDNEISMISNAYSSAEFCNVFIANSVLPNNCGFTYMPRNRARNTNQYRFCIYLKGSKENISCTNPESTTLTHEMGHWLDLPHTFYGWEGGRPVNTSTIENVSRVGSSANCSNAGDYFCDTEADYEANRWSCPNNNNKTYTDPVGVSFKLTPGNFMSYSGDECATGFSRLQREHMVWAMSNFATRAKFKDKNIKLETVEPISNFSPNTKSNIIPKLSINDVVIRFSPSRKVNQKYHLVVSRGSTSFNPKFVIAPSNIVLDTIIMDSVIQLPSSMFLPQDRNVYYWRLTPFAQGGTCGDNGTQVQMFRLSDLNVNIKKIKASCSDSEDGGFEISNASNSSSVYPTRVFDTDGNPFELSSIGLSPGRYSLFIVFSNSDTLYKEIEVESPQPISANIVNEVNSNTVEISKVTGGTQPYSYTWSNGTTGNKLQGEVGKSYIVTITDKNDCKKSIEIKLGVSAISNANTANIELKPNIVNRGEMIMMEGLDQSLSYQISVYNALGALMLHSQCKARDVHQIETQNLSSGIYYIQLSNSQMAYSLKFVVK